MIIITGFTLTGLVLFQTGAIRPHETPLFTGVRITATNNSEVQVVERHVRLFADAYFKYYDLPRTVEVFGSRFEAQFWFQERYLVNGTYEDFMHGPFTIKLSYGSKMIQLNRNNVTLRLL